MQLPYHKWIEFLLIVLNPLRYASRPPGLPHLVIRPMLTYQLQLAGTLPY